MNSDPTEPLAAARRENRALAERVAELERQLARFGADPAARSRLGASFEEREARLLEAERIAQMGSWAWDVATNEVSWSDGMYRILGYDPATTRASFEGFFARIHPEDLERVRGASARSTATGINERVDCRVQHPDGSIRHVTLDAALLFDATGNLVRAVGAAIDVSESREAALALRRSADRLADAQRIGHMGSFEVTLQDQRVVWSDELYRIMDVDPGTPPSPELFVSRLHPDDRAYVALLIERSQLEGYTEPSRARVVRRDGSVRHIDMSAISERDAAGNMIAVRGTVADVTNLVRLEAQFHQSQKMEAVGQLAGGLAHDFNNLLMVITGNVELLLSEQDSPEAREILAAASTATGLTSRLLTFSRHSTQRLRVARLERDLDASQTLIQRTLGDHIVTRFDVAPDLWPVRVDGGQVQQVLLNLALNARDAMPDGGSFSLIARNRSLSHAEAKQRGERAGDYVNLQVTDTGVGMDPPTCARAFEPFFTTKPPGRGTGLGLAMVFGTMKQCGGFIELQSSRGHGTTFQLWFRRALDEERTSQPAPAQAPNLGSCGSVLLVEDNGAVASVAKQILESLGYSVRVALDPQLALELWQAEPADVLITDVEMPGMSGVKLRERLAEHDPQLRTLFITGHSNEQLTSHPNSATLMKPFRRHDLQRALNTLRRP